jgi:hypothetical protein
MLSILVDMGCNFGISCRSGQEYVDRKMTPQDRVRSMPVLRKEIHPSDASRRDILTVFLRVTQQCGVYFLASQMPALAEDIQVTTRVYHDELDGFSISVPQGWTMGTGNLGNKKPDRFSNAAGMQRVLGWAPTNGNSDTSATSIAVTIKTPGADYTGLGSFGTAQDFGEKLVVSIDRSYMTRGWGRKLDEPIITAKLLSAKETRGRYLIEYETGKTGEPTRHVWTLVCFGENTKGLRKFYTVTASCTKEDLGQLKNDLSNALESFEP